MSAAEIAGATAALLTLDANHDGALQPQEMRVRQQTPAERAAHLLDEWDTNHDGKLSPDEVPDGLKPRFAAADKNSDGFLDSTELEQMFATAPQGGTGGNAGDGGPGNSPNQQPKGQHD